MGTPRAPTGNLNGAFSTPNTWWHIPSSEHSGIWCLSSSEALIVKVRCGKCQRLSVFPKASIFCSALLLLSICCCCCWKIHLFKINHKKLQIGWKTNDTYNDLLLVDELYLFVRYFPKNHCASYLPWFLVFQIYVRMTNVCSCWDSWRFLWGSKNEKFSRARRKDLRLVRELWHIYCSRWISVRYHV